MISTRSSRWFLAAMTLAALLGASACDRSAAAPVIREMIRTTGETGLPETGESAPVCADAAPGSFRAYTAWLHSADGV